jgi:hypothetical protein
MKKIVLFTFAMALALLLNYAYSRAAQEATKLRAQLTGAAEVGGGDLKGSGTAQVTVDADKNEVCYDLTVMNVPDATAAHIHEGAVGQDGPVKVPFDAPKTGSAKGCKTADAAVVKAIMQNPSNYYVNVHNTAYPKGAVRGQLSK